VVTKDNLDEFMRESPKVIASIITVLVSRLKSTTKKSLKVPSIGMGVVRILDMFATNGKMELKYESTIKTLADIFVTSTEKIEQYVHGLAQQELLAVGRDTNDRRIIRIRERDMLIAVMQNKKE
jgi:DNA-binding MarR family transcriptional regulator